MLYEFKLSHNAEEAAKINSCLRSKGAVDQIIRNFARVTRSLTIKQGQVDLERWVPRLCSSE